MAFASSLPAPVAGLVERTSPSLTTSKLVPGVECAPRGGHLAGLELTRTAGLSEDESHGQAPFPQHRLQAADCPGIPRWRDTPRSRQTSRHLAQPDPDLG